MAAVGEMTPLSLLGMCASQATDPIFIS
jgi:hypothetical protein